MPSEVVVASRTAGHSVFSVSFIRHHATTTPPITHPQPRREGALLDLMQQSFLAGHDPGIDYPAIDGDAELDEHWARLQAQDAEDRYFSD